MRATTEENIVEQIVKWENGELTEHEILLFFAYLIKTGMCWKLQGVYGRTAVSLIEAEYISEEGIINTEKVNI